MTAEDQSMSPSHHRTPRHRPRSHPHLSRSIERVFEAWTDANQLASGSVPPTSTPPKPRSTSASAAPTASRSITWRQRPHRHRHLPQDHRAARKARLHLELGRQHRARHPRHHRLHPPRQLHRGQHDPREVPRPRDPATSTTRVGTEASTDSNATSHPLHNATQQTDRPLHRT